MPWKPGPIEEIVKEKPFTLEKLALLDPATNKTIYNYHRIKSADFVNILPITSDGRAVLIKQQRAGICDYTLEVPGGMVDPGEDPQIAATRELEEETGYICPALTKLISISPNPALMTNELHMYLAMDASLNPNRQHFPDATEELEVILVKQEELVPMIQKQEINHALAALTIYLGLDKWRELQNAN